jgi:hypothetical protein
MLSRRDLVEKLAAGTAMVWVAGLARTSFASTRRGATAPTGSGRIGAGLDTAAELPATAQAGRGANPTVVDAAAPATLAAQPPWELLRPLKMGSVVADGWRVAGLTGAVDGSCVLTLKNQRGRQHRVHICRNDGNPQGLVYTRHFDLVAMNGGQGDLPTEESFAQAVAEVGHVLAANEGGGTVLASLLPQNERLRRFSGPADRRLR